MTNNASIEILHLFAYAGPNIFGPQPGVLLRLRSATDRSQRLKDALKDGAQFIGLVLAYLASTATSADNSYIITARFTTPTPDIGHALARYVVDGLRAEAAGDDEWDRDTPLYALQKRRRQESLPIAALQLIAEARKRDIPVLHLPTGHIQFGYGARSWQFDPTRFATRKWDDDDDDPAEHLPLPTPPWERLGYIPIYAITGEHQRNPMVQQVAASLPVAAHTVHVLHAADYAATLALLADPTAHTAVIGLDTAAILRRGIAFTRCTRSIITDMQGEQPGEALTATEWTQALGVPMLVSTGPATLNLADPAIATLAPYAPHGLTP